MTALETLTALTKYFVQGLAMYGISMSLAYGGYVGQEWCDPTYCCDPKPSVDQ